MGCTYPNCARYYGGCGEGCRPAKLRHNIITAATISASGLDITIACNDHDTKDAILDMLTGINQQLKEV